MTLTVNVTTRSHEEEDAIAGLVEKGLIDAYDPVDDRLFRARLRRPSVSYMDGRREKHHTLEVRELDRWPEVSRVILDGTPFDVHKYSEHLVDGDHHVARNVVLQLAPGEIARCLAIVEKHGTITFQREGVDSAAFLVRAGGNQRWSIHDEGTTQEHMRQLVRFFPPESRGFAHDFASDKTMWELAATVLRLEVKVRAMAEVLQAAKLINADVFATLTSTKSKDLIRDGDIAEFTRRLYRVDDAAAEIRDQEG